MGEMNAYSTSGLVLKNHHLHPPGDVQYGLALNRRDPHDGEPECAQVSIPHLSKYDAGGAWHATCDTLR